LADQGELQQALQLCEQVLTNNAADLQAHFLEGLIYQALRDNQRAEECFNKTLYLDPNHHEALFYLAFIKEDQGEHTLARRLRERIKRIHQRTAARRAASEQNE
jgi:chemotaxis protein methyltransferase WspC